MVHTRHSKDVEPDSPPRFLALEGKRSRKSRFHVTDVDEHDSDQSGTEYPERDHSIFEDKVVESRLRPRRSYNYVYADSSDEERMARNRHVRIAESSRQESSHQHRREMRRRGRDSSDEDEDEEPKQRGHWYDAGNKPLRQTRSRRQQASHHGEGEDEPDGDVNQEDEDEDDEDVNNCALRRSSRLRLKPFRFRGAAQSEGVEDNSRSADRGKRRHNSDGEENEVYEDMYSRVKRSRTKKTDSRQQQLPSDDSNDDKIESEGETQQRCSYSLREHKPRTQLYMAPAIEAKKKPKQQIIFRETPPRQRHKDKTYRSPAHRKINFRKKHAFHGSSSSTSSDSETGTETSDEQRFSRRKAKSLAKARARICPLNFSNDMLTSSVKDRVRSGASLADVDPMEIDKSVTFESVGGLRKHIMALKEMVVFPLLYPEFYDHFKVAPSRGVLFYGPPGTGKTLVARALANECSRGSQKVAFFMRKGADCLSKWVGEAERQLRLLFDKAYEMRPAIIFFDEIDGLAPVRSSRQDQIHSSIVSTLLALMDGIDARGEIVVIGATNRIDSIDPALRRPGRFDKEFHFPLPSLHDRKKILQIHTKNWTPPLRDDFLLELAEKCAGYCGADIKCMVTEATQNALRRYYPQIYTTADKLQLNIPAIQLTARDFAQAMSNIVPAAQRAVANPAMALEASVRPLLLKPLLKLQALLNRRFPYARLDRHALSESVEQGCSSIESVQLDLDLASDEEDSAPSIFRSGARGCKSNTIQLQCTSFLNYTTSASSFPTVFRPRMLVSGAAGQGQSVHLAPAALHLMEHLPVHILNSSTLFAASAKMPEEACANVFHEAKRTSPSIIFMPYINELWHVVTDSLRVTFLTLVRSMNPSTPVLIMGTSEISYADLDDQLKQLFSLSGGEVMEVDGPTAEERHQFFSNLILQQTIRPPSTHKQAGKMAPCPFTFFPSRAKHKMLSVSCNDGSSELKVAGQSEICRSPDHKTHLPTIKPRSRCSKIRGRANLWVPNSNVNAHVLQQRDTSSMHGKSNNLSQGRKPALTKKCFVNLVKLPDTYVTAFSGQKTKNDTALNSIVLSCGKTGSVVAKNVQTLLGDKSSSKIEKFITSHKANFQAPKTRSSSYRKGISEMESAKTLNKSQVNNPKTKGLRKLNKSRVSKSKNKTSGSCYKRPVNKLKNGAKAATPCILQGHNKAVYLRKKTVTPAVTKNSRCDKMSSRCETLLKQKPSASKISKSVFTSIQSPRPLSKSQNVFALASKELNCRGKQKNRRTSDSKHEKIYANLNYNRSANSDLCLLQYPMALVSASKWYPCLKSPYNIHHQLGPEEARRVLEPLKKALPPEPRKLTEKEQSKLIEQEEDTLRELRIFLRDIVSKLGREKKFSIFTKPVDIEEVPDYYHIVKKPMDLSTVMANIDLHKYNTATAFLDDIFLICSNALEYNPDRGPTDRAIRHRACALRDMAQALLKTELDPDFEKLCQEIEQSRKSRGVDSSQNAPAFYHTRPHSAVDGLASELAAGNNQPQGPTFPEGCRFSRRVRGLEADRSLPLEAVEKTALIEKSLFQNEKNLPVKESTSQDKEDPKVVCAGDDPSDSINEDSVEKTKKEVEATAISLCKCVDGCKCSHSSTIKLGHGDHSESTVKGSSSKHPSPEDVKRAKRLKSQSPWCRPRRRRRLNSTLSFKPSKIVSPVSDGEEVSDDETCPQSEHGLHRDTRSWPDRHEREHSPVSAANPANVNVPGRSRPSLDCQTTSGQNSLEEASVAASMEGVVADQDNKGTNNCDAARSLDAELIATAIDSGIGSESNGDSRDSLVDQNNSNRSGIKSTGKVIGCGEDETATVSAGSSLAHTRSRAQNPLQMNALAALEVETQSVHVDKEQLARLLDTVVATSKGYTIETMQQLYSVLSCSIYNHRREYDKTQLVQEMEHVVENFCNEARH